MIERVTSPLVRRAKLTSVEKRSMMSRRRGTRHLHQIEWSEPPAPPPWSRAQLGWAERFREDYVCLCARDGRSYELRISQAPVASGKHALEAAASSDGGLSTGSTVWDAGIVLARHAATVLSHSAAGAILIDLGAGTGHVGLTISALCPRGVLGTAMLTDLPAVLPLLEANVARNAHALPPELHVHAVAYRWGDDHDLEEIAHHVHAVGGHPHVLCVGGDLLYREETIEPLVNALCELLGVSGAHGALTNEALISTSMEHSPDTAMAFVDAATDAGLTVQQVPFDQMDPHWRSPSVVVLSVTVDNTSFDLVSAMVI